MDRDSTVKKVVLALVSNAYGGRGGIALYNRNLLNALSRHRHTGKIVALPRSITYRLEEMPRNLSYIENAAGGKFRYLFACVRAAFSIPRIDLIVCGHLHLLPFAYFLRLFFKCPVVPVIYGVEAWAPTPHRIANYLCRKLDVFIAIHRLTAKRFIRWAGLNKEKYYYLPNCIDESKYGLGPKRPDLLVRYGLTDKVVIMTAGRLDTFELDRNKGFDEVLEVLPELRQQMPDLMYLVMGDGDDRERLEQKAAELSVDDIVRFTGYVSDDEKADHYRLADVFAMPGSSKIFDRYPYRFVFLEALACGVPVVGCRFEDESEVNDSDAQLIIQVDPNDKEDIKIGIMKALNLLRGFRSGIDNFYYTVFERCLHEIVDDLLIHSPISRSERPV